MFGLLLNTFKKTNKYIDDVKQIINFSKNVFGTSTIDYTLPSNFSTVTLDALNRVSPTMCFHNLTVPEGVALNDLPNYTNSGTIATYGTYSPMYIKCSGTLTVNGTIAALGGGKNKIGNQNNDVWAPVPITIPTITGFSAHYNTFTRLHTYGANATFFKYEQSNKKSVEYETASFRPGSIFDFQIVTATNELNIARPLFLCGGGGSSNVRIANNPYPNFGISAGGGAIGSSFGDWGAVFNVPGGGGGGFVALYYRRLIINGKEYGVDPGCEVFRISANGTGGATTATPVSRNGGNGGGCIVISADTIIIGPNGGIHADGYGIRPADDVGKEYSFLNNIPQLHPNQQGVYWDNTKKEFVNGINAERVYYYDDGTGNGICNQSIESGTADYCGGAGVALGFKVK